MHLANHNLILRPHSTQRGVLCFPKCKNSLGRHISVKTTYDPTWAMHRSLLELKQGILGKCPETGETHFFFEVFGFWHNVPKQSRIICRSTSVPVGTHCNSRASQISSRSDRIENPRHLLMVPNHKSEPHQSRGKQFQDFHLILLYPMLYYYY